MCGPPQACSMISVEHCVSMVDSVRAIDCRVELATLGSGDDR